MCKEEYRQQNQDGRPEIVPLHYSGSLAKTVLNSLSANIAILDEYGVILQTNQAWRNYATENKMEGSDDSIGVNYLELCDATTGKEAKYARDVAAGIRSVIKGETKEFLEPAGSGMALGVDKHCRYEENRMDDFRRGGIIVMGTDGVWEARNGKGLMFGRTAIYDVIRDNSAAGAGDIIEAILSRIKNFRKTEQPEDDVTLVVVKLL